jgi:phage FluMu protein Com
MRRVDDMYLKCSICNQHLLSIVVHVFLGIKSPKSDNVTRVRATTATISSPGQIPLNQKRTWHPLSICRFVIIVQLPRFARLCQCY